MSDDKLQRFAAGEAFVVDPDAVEKELASLWRTAGRSDETQAPVTRACLLNVVAILEEREGREGYGAAGQLQQWIDELPRYVAARSLVVRNQPDVDGQNELKSWISANCIIADGGGKLVCSEEVTIAAQGGADHHIPSLARALLVPGLPTSVVFSGIPYGALVDPVLDVADRVVTDVDASLHQAPLSSLGRMTRDGYHSEMDLGWVKTAGLRAELASAFDPPFDGDSLGTVRRVHCATPAAVQWSSRLLLGWLAQSLGAEDPVASGDGESKLHRPSGEPLQLKLTVDDSLAGPSFEFDSSAWSAPVNVWCSNGLVHVEGPHLPAARRPRQELAGPAALARALISRAEDGAFRRAVDIAEFLQ